MIKLEHVKKEYPNATPLSDVNVEIHDGDVISVIGPSGTGKSTLLRCINLLERPTSGRIWLDDVEITGPDCDIYKIRQKMGMVFQSFNLFGHLKVIENIMFGPVNLLGKSRQEAYDEGMRLLDKVGLTEKAMDFPDALSGGQKQRVAIVRTLAMHPELILMDEPTSALDPTMVSEVQAVIRNLAETGTTMMIVTHEMEFARSISNRVFYMDEGVIYEDGPPEQVFDNPRRSKTRRFIRRLKVLEIEIKKKNYDFLALQGRIENYCKTNQIPSRIESDFHLIFEEIVHQMLITKLEEPDILVTIEYTTEKRNGIVTIEYDGDRMDVTKTGDKLSLALLKSAAKQIRYEWDPDEKRGNRITMNV